MVFITRPQPPTLARVQPVDPVVGPLEAVVALADPDCHDLTKLQVAAYVGNQPRR